MMGIYNAVFAAIYDPILWLGERAGMSKRRRQVLSSAHGRVLELGAGTGLNIGRYPNAIDELVLTEPDESMAKRLEGRVEREDREGEVVRAPAESLPVEDDSFDTVVSTFVLCTVDEPRASLREVRRVLRPEGRLLFIEHVRADHPRLARWQDRLHNPWHAFACGCHANRATLETIREEGFEVSDPDRSEWRMMPPLVRPIVSGDASPA